MKISVALCTYNGGRYLESQINSILKQSVKVDEIVFCDDRSTDSTLLIIENFRKEYPERFKIYINEKNLGAKLNFQKGIELASGDVIFLSDQDDVWPGEKVEEVLKIFETNPGIEGVFTNGEIMNSGGEKLWDSFMYTKYMQKFLNENSLFEMILKNGAIVTGATLAISNKAKETILPFRNIEKFWHDEWIALSLSAEDALYPLNKNLFTYRLHDQQQIGIYVDDYENRVNKRERYFKKEPELSEVKDYIFYIHYRLINAREVVQYFPKKKLVLENMENEFSNEKKKWLRKFNWFYRKSLLLKWFIERRFEISLMEVLTT